MRKGYFDIIIDVIFLFNEGTKNKRHYLRFSGHLERGRKGVLLELEVESEKVFFRQAFYSEVD